MVRKNNKKITSYPADELFDFLQKVAFECLEGNILARDATVFYNITKWRLSVLDPKKYGDNVPIPKEAIDIFIKK